MAYKNKEDQKAYARKHYQENKDLYRARSKVNRPQCIARNKQWLLEYLREHPCVDCGETDVEVLEFDHIDLVGSKARRIGSHISSLGRLKKEVAKCAVRCANCHTRRTRRQLGWFRDTDGVLSQR